MNETKIPRPASEDGADDSQTLLQEFDEAKAHGQLPEIPENLDRKCRKTVFSHFSKRKPSNRLFIRRVAIYATALLCTFSFFAGNSTASERPPYYISLNEPYGWGSIKTRAGTVPETLPTPTSMLEQRKTDPLAGLISSDYHLIYHETDVIDACRYETDDGLYIDFSFGRIRNGFRFDVEDAEVSIINLQGHDCILVKKNGYRLYWIDLQSQLNIHFTTSNTNYDQVLEMATEIAQCPDWVNIIYGGATI